jgi:hypothetical protein
MPAGHDFVLRARDAGTGDGVTLSIDTLPTGATTVEVYRLDDGAYATLAATITAAGDAGAQIDAGLATGTVARYLAMGVALGVRGLPVREASVRVAAASTIATAVLDALQSRLDGIDSGPRVQRGPEPHPRSGRELAYVSLDAITARRATSAGSHDVVEYTAAATVSVAGRSPEIRQERSADAIETMAAALDMSPLSVAHPGALAVLSQHVRAATAPRENAKTPDLSERQIAFVISVLQAKGALTS